MWYTKKAFVHFALLIFLILSFCLYFLAKPLNLVYGRPPQPTPTPSPQGNQGLQPGWVIDNNGHLLFTNEIAKTIAETKAGWVRINFRLGGFQDWTETTTFGYSALSLYDQVVANALNNNLKILGLLSNESWHGNQPDWQAGNAENGLGNGDNIYLQEFSKNAAVVLASYFADRINAWEVWNEPNAPTTYIYPSNFSHLLAHVYVDTKQAGVTGVEFISGGLYSHEGWGNRIITSSNTGADYLRNTYAQGRKLANWEGIKSTYGSYPLDEIGQHLYIDQWAQTNSTRIAEALRFVREAYLAEEGTTTAKKTYLAELGWSTKNVSERIQAKNLEIVYATCQKTSFVAKVYWFCLKDEPAADLFYGLIRPDSTRKPAFSSYQQYAAY